MRCRQRSSHQKLIILPRYSFTLTNLISFFCTAMSRPKCPVTETAGPKRPDRIGQTETGQTEMAQTETAQTETARPKSRVPVCGILQEIMRFRLFTMLHCDYTVRSSLVLVLANFFLVGYETLSYLKSGSTQE